MKQIFPILLLLITTFTIAQDRKFPPPNEAIKDELLKTFLIQLKEAVQKKDTAFIYTSLSQNIKNSFGGNDGIKEFKEIWKLKKPNSTFWYYMNRALSMPGCIQNNNTEAFSLPYIFCIPLKDNEDAFQTAVITEKNVALKQKPNKTSKTIYTLSYNVVSFVSNPSGAISTKGKNEVGDQEWYQIELLNGKKKIKGWVYYKYIYSPIGYRVILAKENGKWLIQTFVAGD
ncbi:MAG TPA: hypothetical protein PK772_00535 [Chitinophagaceae bacterium]|nr:hypothetical protein [Chitinophagaceae bacterium]